MDNEAKFKLDGLELLRKAAWDSFERRTAIEWKLSLSLWTALAAFIGSIATGKVPVHSYVAVIILTVIAVMLCYLHFIWLRGMGKANNLDRKRENFFADRMMELIPIKYTQDLITEMGDRSTKKLSVWNDYAHKFQLGVTATLSLGVIGTILWAAAR